MHHASCLSTISIASVQPAPSPSLSTCAGLYYPLIVCGVSSKPARHHDGSTVNPQQLYRLSLDKCVDTPILCWSGSTPRSQKMMYDRLDHEQSQPWPPTDRPAQEGLGLALSGVCLAVAKGCIPIGTWSSLHSSSPVVQPDACTEEEFPVYPDFTSAEHPSLTTLVSREMCIAYLQLRM